MKKFIHKIYSRIKYEIGVFVCVRYKVYHFFDVDYSLPINKKHIDEFFRLNADLINGNFRFRPSDGTLLGFLRGDDIIDHDNDYDYDVEYSAAACKEIFNICLKREFKLGRKVVVNGNVHQLCFVSKTGNIFDFIFWQKAGSVFYNFSEEKTIRVMPAKFLENLDYFHSKRYDKKFLIPIDWQDWLVFRYGSGWNVPKKSKGDWKLDCGDLIGL